MLMVNHNLRLFAAVADAGNITDAAKKMYVTQPSVSQAIKKLESELSLTLFHRSKTGVLLTDAGKEVLLMTRQMLDLENRINQYSYQQNHLEGGILKIASVPLATTKILSPLLPIYKKMYPDVQIELYENNSVEVRKMVEEYRADLGFGTSPYMTLDHRVLIHDHIVSVSCKGPTPVDLYETDEQLIFCSNSHEAVLDKLNEKNIRFKNEMIIEMPVSLVHMVKHNMGIGIMSETLLSQYNETGLYTAPITPHFENDISLLARDFDDLSPSARMLKKMILQED